MAFRQFGRVMNDDERVGPNITHGSTFSKRANESGRSPLGTKGLAASAESAIPWPLAGVTPGALQLNCYVISAMILMNHIQHDAKHEAYAPDPGCDLLSHTHFWP